MNRTNLLDKPLTETRRLASVAGSPLHRRGSVLVLVVGILALMAIIVVVYTTIGQADARAGRVMVAKTRLDDQSKAIGDYIARIIGDNASAVYPQDITASQSLVLSQFSVRQSWDYPSTDPEARSIVTNTPFGTALSTTEAAARRFNPTGSITTPWNPSFNSPAAGPMDPRLSSDPWLASIEPTWINDKGTLTLPTPQELMLSQRHWLHLSAIAPDGRAVNLANLRGNFNAPSGFSQLPYATASNAISDHLYKLADAGVLAPLSGSSYQEVALTGGVNGEEYNNPYTWSTNQMEVFRPVEAGMSTAPTLSTATAISLGDVRHLSNLFADADGDGFYDSFWQELVDAADFQRPVSMLPAGGLRIFVAPRIIDLSGLVNVNTATSMSAPPTANYPAGLTPSDVDLERLLSTADVRQYFGIDLSAGVLAESTTGPLGYMQSVTAGDMTNVGRAGFGGVLWNRVDVAGRPGWLPASYPVANPEGVDITDNTVLALAGNGKLLEYIGANPALGTNKPKYLTAGARAELYTLGGRDPRDGAFDHLAGGAANAYGVWSTGAFGMADEKELRAFGAVNDPNTMSRLESAVESRWSGNDQVGPLRSGRDKQTERDVGLTSALAATTNNEYNTAANQLMTQFNLDVRHLLTTASGARPIGMSATLVASPTAYARSLSTAEVRPDINLLLNTVYNSTETAVNRRNAVRDIFRGYARALMPLAGMNTDVWEDFATSKPALTVSYGGVTYKADGTTDDPTTNSNFTGRAAEFAHRSAAHMTANLLGWRDEGRYQASPPPANDFGDDVPLGATLLIDEAFRTTITSEVFTGGTAQRYPWWNAAIAGSIDALTTTPEGVHAPRALALDLNDNNQPTPPKLLLDSSTTTLDQTITPRAMNIYAARPQLFLTEVASFVMYTDAPSSAGGDGGGAGGPQDEWEAAGPLPTDPITSHGITINGETDINANTNPDFLCQVVAFQITNPFDVDLPLYSTGGVQHYLEFGNQTYDLAEYGTGTPGTPTPISIAAHDSRVFFALSQDPAAIALRWSQAGAGASSAADVKTWIINQLKMVAPATSALDPVRIMPINPVDWTPATPATAVKLLDTTNSGMADTNRQALLWRRVLLTGETAAANDLQNDYLVDRLADSRTTAQQPTLYRNLPSVNNHFTSIPAGPEAGSPRHTAPGMELQNTGYSIVLWGTLKRPLDPNGGPIKTGWTSGFPSGALPAYCVEAKQGNGFGAVGGKSLNVQDYNANLGQTTNAAARLTAAFFRPADNDGDHTLSAMLAKQKNTKFIIKAITEHPSQRPSDAATAGVNMPDNFAGTKWKEGHLATQLPVVPRRTIAANTVTALNEPKQPPLRPADLLMPWAIGPYELPGNGTVNFDTPPGTAASVRFDNLAKRWTTLSEAMGFGLNYSRADEVKKYERQIGKALDNNRLALDRYVPFNDLNTNGRWDGPVTGGTFIDPRPLRGIPAALAILDQFRTTPYGTILTPVYGTVNINTAPLSVLRMLPFLYPHSANVLTDSDASGFPNLWDNASSATLAGKVNGTAKSLWDTSLKYYDPAATLAAYRDKLAVVSRGQYGAEVTSARLMPDATDINDNVTETAADNNTTRWDANGRSVMTGVINVQEERGFRSPGEVMMALVRGELKRTAGTPLDAVGNNSEKEGLSIDRLAYDAKGTGYMVTEYPPASAPAPSVAYPPARDVPMAPSAMTLVKGNKLEANGTVSTYEQKLAIANALLNTISVRSDIFCAYFLVNGYQPSDVEGLRAYYPRNAGAASDVTSEDITRPMVPSVQRRYMMVVDRSNCIQTGDKPKILLFEELPVK